MTEDTYSYTTTTPIDEHISNIINIQYHYDKPPGSWMNKKLRSLRLLQKSSQFLKETGSSVRLYHYEMPSRDITYLTLIDPDFVRDLTLRTEYLLRHNAHDLN